MKKQSVLAAVLLSVFLLFSACSFPGADSLFPSFNPEDLPSQDVNENVASLSEILDGKSFTRKDGYFLYALGSSENEYKTICFEYDMTGSRFRLSSVSDPSMESLWLNVKDDKTLVSSKADLVISINDDDTITITLKGTTGNDYVKD